ncbi:MAG: hypothetical protein RLY66_325 [Candidatus Parcubacteria bacterium]|jgi:hypothetical protein
MACIMECPVCGGTMHEGTLHHHCFIAVPNDLLFRIQEQLKTHPERPLPDDLKKEVLEGSYVSLEQFKQQRLFERKEGENFNFVLPGMIDDVHKLPSATPEQFFPGEQGIHAP